MDNIKSFILTLFSEKMLKFGWSFFWRWYLFLHIPYLFITEIINIARSNITNTNILIQIVLGLGYVIYANVVIGYILNRMQNIFKYENKFTYKGLFSLGSILNGFIFFLLLLVFNFISVALFIPSNFVLSFFVGLVLGFQGRSADILPTSITVIYFFNNFISIFIYGYLAKVVISWAIKREGK